MLNKSLEGLPKNEVLIKLELLKEKEVQMHVPPNYGLKPAAAKTESILPKDAGTRGANRVSSIINSAKAASIQILKAEGEIDEAENLKTKQ